jgi:ADP-ribose pyrophosphatase YjhB (NUDIX family)
MSRPLAAQMADSRTDDPAPRFARYRPSERSIQGRHFWSVPEGGVCLSAFVVLRSMRTPTSVLLGRPDPQAPWEQMATLEEAHLRSIGNRWILPASHLREFEAPADSADRILREQLEITDLPLRGPDVFSESYPSAIDPESGMHWDLHFVFRGDWPSEEPPRSGAWRELAFIDPRTVTRSDIARGHADILTLAGFPVREPARD